MPRSAHQCLFFASRLRRPFSSARGARGRRRRQKSAIIAHQRLSLISDFTRGRGANRTYTRAGGNINHILYVQLQKRHQNKLTRIMDSLTPFHSPNLLLFRISSILDGVIRGGSGRETRSSISATVQRGLSENVQGRELELTDIEWVFQPNSI